MGGGVGGWAWVAGGKTKKVRVLNKQIGAAPLDDIWTVTERLFSFLPLRFGSFLPCFFPFLFSLSFSLFPFFAFLSLLVFLHFFFLGQCCPPVPDSILRCIIHMERSRAWYFSPHPQQIVFVNSKDFSLWPVT